MTFSAAVTAVLYGCALSVVVSSVAERNVVHAISPRQVSWAEPTGEGETGRRRVRLHVSGRLVIAIGLVLGLGPLLVADTHWPLVAFDAALLVVLAAVSIVDAWEYRIPDRIVLPAIGVTALLVVGWSLGLLGFGTEELDPIPVLAGSAAFTALIGVPHVLRPDAMGLGDVKLAILLGAAIGLHAADGPSAVASVGWALVAASAIGLAAAAVSRRDRSTRVGLIPFGPPLSLGTWLVIVAGA